MTEIEWWEYDEAEEFAEAVAGDIGFIIESAIDARGAAVIALAGGGAGLRDRVRRQADALCALGGPALSDAELDTPVPTRLLSNGTCLVDQPMPLRDLLGGLAETELPGHTRQLLSLLTAPAGMNS